MLMIDIKHVTIFKHATANEENGYRKIQKLFGLSYSCTLYSHSILSLMSFE